jgi:hypothetical protein
MIDSDRVITLDELVESVPEVLIREAEQRVSAEEHAVEEVNYSIKDPLSMSKDLSKAQRIRLYMENNPEARNKDVVEALKGFSVTAADVANVKSIAKRQAASSRSSSRVETPVASAARKPVSPSTTMTKPVRSCEPSIC